MKIGDRVEMVEYPGVRGVVHALEPFAVLLDGGSLLESEPQQWRLQMTQEAALAAIRTVAGN